MTTKREEEQEIEEAPSPPQSTGLPAKVILAAGTYDGALAGYEIQLRGNNNNTNDEDDESSDNEVDDDKSNKLHIVFASPVHGGSVRSLTMSRTSANNNNNTTKDGATSSSSSSCLLLSTGYDEMLQTHDFGKRLTSSGQVRTPADFGTPVCSAFAPPHGVSTHCLVGFDSSSGSNTGTTDGGGGKLVIYKKRDWSVQHVLNGHEGGVASVAVHPTGKLALTGGSLDGKLKLWDLERGRLAFSSPTIKAAATHVEGRKHYDAIVSIVWSEEGDCYAFCHGSHITVRDVATGKDLLDVDIPAKVNQVCLMQGPEGLFVAAAGNDGSLPVLAVEDVDGDEAARRAIMAIEPVDGPVAGDERFKCIQTVTGYYVATANSGGVVSLMNLQGSVTMITSPSSSGEGVDDDDEEKPVNSDSDSGEDDDDTSDDLAVEIVDSVLLGSGSRITCLAAWVAPLVVSEEEPVTVNKNSKKQRKLEAVTEDTRKNKKKQKRGEDDSDRQKNVVMDSEKLEKARALVHKAKKIQKRKSKKKQKQQQLA